MFGLPRPMALLAEERSQPTKLAHYFEVGGIHKSIGKGIILKIHSHAVYITIHDAPRRAVYILLKWIKKHVQDHVDTATFELSFRQGKTLRPFVDRVGILRLSPEKFYKLVKKQKITQLVLSQNLVGGSLHDHKDEFLFDFK